jgi:subtilase family serine protease
MTMLPFRAAVVALAALVLLGPMGAAPEASLAVARAAPFIQDHITRGGLKDPPDTAFCQANLGIACYRPGQIQKAYNLQPLFGAGLNGAGRTIVIVDAFGSPTIKHDLQVFDRTFGLPDPPAFDIIQPVGVVPPFDPDAFGGDEVSWAEETSLDVEWSHVMAPGAKILLVETPVDETEGVQGFPEIVAAENYVIDHNLGDVISQSFGATEQTFPNRQAILNLRSAFKNARDHHVSVLGSSGDQGATDLKLDLSCCYPMRVDSWPSADPLVTSVGGTQLHLDAAGNRTAPDNVWNDSCAVSAAACFGAAGGGLSSTFIRPDYQDRVRSVVGDRRGTPDVSLSAAVDGGVVVYFTFILPGSPWHVFGGTSEASPLFAGVVAIADQAAGHRLGWLNPRLYRLGDPRLDLTRRQDDDAGLVDITRGNNTFIFCATNCGAATETDTTVTGFDATRGYDLASGLGTIDATRLVHALAHDRGDDRGDDRAQ